MDRIFLLSVDEVISHYSFNSWYDEYKMGYSMDLIIPATEYAKNQGGVACGKITEDYYNGYNDDRGGWHARYSGVTGNDGVRPALYITQ